MKNVTVNGTTYTKDEYWNIFKDQFNKELRVIEAKKVLERVRKGAKPGELVLFAASQGTGKSIFAK